jgi:hypothetical protein
MMDKFVVTKEWIAANATPAGGYKNEQLRIISVQIPARAGWPARAEGRVITTEQKLKFEAFHEGYKATKKSKTVMAGDDFDPIGDCDPDDVQSDADEAHASSEAQKEFQAWAKKHAFNVTKDKQVISEGAFIYANPMTQGAYMAWCAAKNGA